MPNNEMQDLSPQSKAQLAEAIEAMRDLFFIHDHDEVQEILLEMFHNSQISDVHLIDPDAREDEWILYRNLKKLITACNAVSNG